MITIYGELYSKKNSKRIFKNKNTGLSFITSSKQSKKSDIDLMYQLRDKKQEWDDMVKGLEYPLYIVFKMFRKTNRPFDYINLVQGCLDNMVKSEWLPDDNMNYVVPVFKEYEKDKSNPRCEISIIAKTPQN